MDLKLEIETSFNTYLDIDQYLNAFEKDLKTQQKVKVPPKQMKAIRNLFKKKDKKQKHHLACIEMGMYSPEGFMHPQDELMLYTAKHGHDKDDKEDEDKPEVNVPAELVFGVTVSLVGMFLFLLPFPGCKDWGKGLITSGFMMCGKCISGKMDKEEEDKKRDKK